MQVMTFQFGDESYGVDISRIREIVEFIPLTSVPKAPGWIEGIVNHHGRVVTVINLATFFDLPSRGELAVKRIAILDDPSVDIGLLLENPLEVISEWETSAEAPGHSDFARSRYVGKILTRRDRVINLMDVNKLVDDIDSYFA